jgi:hypothetical protein
MSDVYNSHSVIASNFAHVYVILIIKEELFSGNMVLPFCMYALVD